MLALLLPACASLLSEGYRIESPCPSAVAATVSPAAALDDDAVHWVGVFPGVKPLQTAMFTLPTNPTSVGAPVAVARLDVRRARLDGLRSTIPKEDPQAIALLGLALDGAIEAWVAHCASPSAEHEFESLVASSTPQTAKVLATRGFGEVDDVAVDFSALGRGESIATHRVRLPGAILAMERRAQTCDDMLERAMAQSILDAMRQQPSPTNLDATSIGRPAEAATERKKDPWGGIKGFGF